MIAETPYLQKRLGLAAGAALLCLGIGLRLANLSIVTGRSPDETNYTRQANTLLQDGTAGLRAIAAEYQRDPAARLAGPPTRAGYLWMLAAAMRLTGRNDENVGALLSCAASIGSLFILTLIGIRFFPPWATLFALLFLAVCPAELELARRIWADALVGFLGLSLVYVAGEITRDSRRRIWHWLFVLLGCLGILVKEFGPVVFGFCAVWVLWVMLIQRRDFKSGLSLMAGVMAGTGISVAWIANSIGGFSILVQTVINWRAAHVTNYYAIEYQSGPGYLLLRAFQIISPVAALFCVIGLAVMLLSHRRLGFLRLPAGAANWQVIGWMALFLLGYLALAMLLPHWLNLRYVSVLFGPFYLLAGVGFWYAASVCWSRLGIFHQSRDRKGAVARIAFAAVIILGLVIAAFSDYRRFDRMFVRNGLGDLSVKLVLDRADMTAAEKQVKRSPTAENYLNLCRLYDRNWRYTDSVAACRKALQLRPNYAEAYNNLSAAYVEQEMWDEAIQASQQALKLNPDLPLARDNLARSLDQKRLRDAANTPTQ
jgi:dolichyl-phosphate-mannose-protein mannosyltransferase/tetratricopeptide repeat protein